MNIYRLHKELNWFPQRTARHMLLIGISLLLITMIAACGRRGPVRPKLQSLPAAPQEVTLQQQGAGLMLAWTMPEQNQDGSRTMDLTRFRILRLAFDAEEACPTCRDPEETVATVDLSYPAPAQRVGKRFYWFDEDVSLGYGYRYRIVPVTIGRQAGQAADIHRSLQLPPPVPTGLKAEAGDRQVVVEWQAPDLAEGVERIGYNVYRRHYQQPFVPVPINPEPLTETSLLDRGLKNGQAYEYRVSVLVRSGENTLESAPSTSLLITPQNR